MNSSWTLRNEADEFVHRDTDKGVECTTLLAFNFHFTLHEHTFAEQLFAVTTAVFFVPLFWCEWFHMNTRYSGIK